MICWTVFPRQNGSWPITPMTPIGSGTDWRKKGSAPAFQAKNPAQRQSVTTSTNTGAAIVSKSCSAGSRTGSASPRATTDVQPSSSQLSASPPLSCSGYES